MWRRVIEVSGGGWVQEGEAWTNNVFAYNLSIACNHCVHPKCAGVCPTDAYVHRPDGIVYIDPDPNVWDVAIARGHARTMLRATTLNLGQMAKCNFCFDNIDAGLPPSCVAACPMRVLNFVEVDEDVDRRPWSTVHGPRSMVRIVGNARKRASFPLPNNSRTEPHLAVKPHVAMGNDLEKKISNYEEIQSQTPKERNSVGCVYASCSNGGWRILGGAVDDRL